MTKRGLLFVYSGPSGVGKGTLMVPYLQTHPDSVLSVSMTTRAARPGERQGIEYDFVSRERFLSMIEAEGFLEYAEYNGNFYGTPRDAVERLLAEGKNVVLEIEVQGAMRVKNACPEAVLLFVLPPSWDCLRERLVGRGTEEAQVVEKRLEIAKSELAMAREYQYLIVNDDADEARARLAAVIAAAACEYRFMKDYIEKVCELV